MDTPTMDQRFAEGFSAYLNSAPEVSFGFVLEERRQVQFSSSGVHEYWVFRTNDDELEMLIGFHKHDLVVKVMNAEEVFKKPSGETLLFSGAESFLSEGKPESPIVVVHHFKVNPSGLVSRDKLISGLKRISPEQWAVISPRIVSGGKLIIIGLTNDYSALLELLFLYAYGVEKVKRSLLKAPGLVDFVEYEEDEDDDESDEDEDDEDDEDEDNEDNQN